MLKVAMAWMLLGSAILAGALAIYWRDKPEKQILVILILSIQASVFEGINMVFLTKQAKDA